MQQAQEQFCLLYSAAQIETFDLGSITNETGSDVSAVSQVVHPSEV